VKGKVCQPYEFGVKVSIATTHKEGLVVGIKSMPDNPYDGYTLPSTVEQIHALTHRKPKAVSWIEATVASQFLVSQSGAVGKSAA